MAATFQDYPRPVAGGELDTVRALLHDLRQPLAAILLLSGAEGGDNARKMNLIEGQARWLAELVEAVLSDASDDDVESIDLTTVVRRATERAQVTASCPIKIDVVGAPQAWARPVAGRHGGIPPRPPRCRAGSARAFVSHARDALSAETNRHTRLCHSR